LQRAETQQFALCLNTHLMATQYLMPINRMGKNGQKGGFDGLKCAGKDFFNLIFGFC
jgi:hypothetical protein